MTVTASAAASAAAPSVATASPGDRTVVLRPCGAQLGRDQLRELAIRGVGFLDCDPRVQPIQAMVERLADRQAVLFVAGADDEPASAGLVAFAPNPRQGSQWVIDVLPAAGSTDPSGLVRAAVAFAAEYLAARSLLRYGQVRDDRGPLLRAAGFVELGRLPGALYEDGEYHDQPVWFFGNAMDGRTDHASAR